MSLNIGVVYDGETFHAITQLAEKCGTKKSEVVRAAVSLLLAQENPERVVDLYAVDSDKRKLLEKKEKLKTALDKIDEELKEFG